MFDGAGIRTRPASICSRRSADETSRCRMTSQLAGGTQIFLPMNNTSPDIFPQSGLGWLGSRVVSVLDSGAEGPGFKSQSRRCRAAVLGKLFTPIVPLFTK